MGTGRVKLQLQITHGHHESCREAMRLATENQQLICHQEDKSGDLVEKCMDLERSPKRVLGLFHSVVFISWEMRRKRSWAVLCMQSRANELPSLREVEEERAVGAGWERVKTFFFFFFQAEN